MVLITLKVVARVRGERMHPLQAPDKRDHVKSMISLKEEVHSEMRI